jgi:hypothetical protein
MNAKNNNNNNNNNNDNNNNTHIYIYNNIYTNDLQLNNTIQCTKQPQAIIQGIVAPVRLQQAEGQGTFCDSQ